MIDENKERVQKYIVVPCEMDPDGKVSMSKRNRIPYGFHHINRVYDDGSYWLIASVDCRIDQEKCLDIASIIADGKPVEVDPDLYLK